MDRRSFVKYLVLGAELLALRAHTLLAQGTNRPLLTRPIPSSGEVIPVIGMGTWITFNVGPIPPLIQARVEILKTFFAMGGQLIDSSPMYGSAEEVLGRCFQQLNDTESLFAATKVWTSNTSEGLQQVQDSERLWGLDRMDLEQIHNLVNWREHLKSLQRLKEEGRIRYIRITTSHGRRHAELEAIMKSEPLDFVQLTYNLERREVENRLLPLAQDKGIAVIANRPFGGGALIDRLQRSAPLPTWASEVGAANWPEFLLKFVVSHPALTCAIPATSQVEHMRENMRACYGRLPDAAQRERMVRYLEEL